MEIQQPGDAAREGRTADRRTRLVRLAWPVAAVAPLAAGVLLCAHLASVASVPRGSGWTERTWSNERFEGAPASERVVSEPFVPDEPGQPFSAEWTSYLRTDKPLKIEFVVEADDEVELLVGDKSILHVTGALARTEHPAPAQALPPGVVPVTLRLVDHGGGRYLRLYFNELTGPHGWLPVPWPRGISWPARELAEAAVAPMAETTRLWLFGAALMLLTLGAAIGWRTFAAYRGRESLGRRELAVAAAIVLVALAARVNGLSTADIYWDEGAYLKAGMHYVRNAELGDWATQSFRWNKEHPPIAKWLYGGVERVGGMWGAKLAAAYLQALTCLILFLIGRRYASLAVGASAGMVLALMPYFVGHGRSVGLESPLTFFFTVSALLLMLACERDSFWLHGAWGLTSILGVGSRATGVWFAPLALTVCLAALASRRSRFVPMIGAFAGAAAGVLVLFAAWPWLWHSPIEQMQSTYSHWAAHQPEEYFLGKLGKLPGWYYVFAFLVSSPTGLLVLAAIWIGFAVRRRSPLDWLVLGWLVFPFGQGASSMRQDGARYVIQAFPALALAAAIGLDLVVDKLGRPYLRKIAPAALWLYVAGAMLSVQPYQLDYCSEWTGGPAKVMARRWIEIPFWGEGHRELADELNRMAPPGAKVHLRLMPHDDFPGLRPDLIGTSIESADYLLMNFFQFPAEPPGFRRIYEVRAGNGIIGAVYQRDRQGSPGGPMHMTGN